MRQPAYAGCEIRAVGELPHTDFVMDRIFWIGVYPGLTRPMLDHIGGTITGFVADRPSASHRVRCECRCFPARLRGYPQAEIALPPHRGSGEQKTFQVAGLGYCGAFH
jgi:hypothetical protein